MMNFGGYLGGMYGMGAMGAGNVNQYYKAKYGCEDCLMGRPYYQMMAKPRINMAEKYSTPNFIQRFLKKIGC